MFTVINLFLFNCCFKFTGTIRQPSGFMGWNKQTQWNSVNRTKCYFFTSKVVVKWLLRGYFLRYSVKINGDQLGNKPHLFWILCQFYNIYVFCVCVFVGLCVCVCVRIVVGAFWLSFVLLPASIMMMIRVFKYFISDISNLLTLISIYARKIPYDAPDPGCGSDFITLNIVVNNDFQALDKNPLTIYSNCCYSCLILNTRQHRPSSVDSACCFRCTKYKTYFWFAKSKRKETKNQLKKKKHKNSISKYCLNPFNNKIHLPFRSTPAQHTHITFISIAI